MLIALILAGETAGTLAESLETAAAQFEREHDLRCKVSSAFVYPALVLGAATLVVGLMLFFVVPVFARIYQNMNATLPILTRLLVGTSGVLLRYGPLLAAAGVGIVVAIRRYCGTEPGRERLDRLKLRLPLFGPLNRKVVVSRFVQTLAAMIQSGVPLTRGLEIAAVVTGNRVIAQVVRQVIVEVVGGAKLSAQLARTGEFPPMVTRMVAVGETSGALERMLLEAARLYDREVEHSVKQLTTMLEPILTMCLSFIIGLVVMALYLPIFGLVKR
jgi:type IV pilus assembly protein PilC